MKFLSKPDIIFILSVDTEEEFDWDGAFPQENCSIENIKLLPGFQQYCASLGVRPTYLVDYPVAANDVSAAILRGIAQSGQAEIGAHLHPWCTPPLEGANTERESHVVNLPPDLVRRKLDVLTSIIRCNIGVNPTVFRTGRWGVNGTVLRIMEQAGYRVDSSIYPYYSNEYFSCLDAYDRPYWPDFECQDRPGSQRSLFELPVTAGFNRPDFPFWGKVHRILSLPLLRPLRPVGLAWWTRVLRKLYLSPELSTVDEMKELIKAALASDHSVIHMFLHSSSLLQHGGSVYGQRGGGCDDLFSSIQKVVEFLSDRTNVTFCTVSEAAKRLTDGAVANAC